jgi:hypothetical protein
MGNIKNDYGSALIGRTYRNNDKPTFLIIPKDLAKSLQIESSRVSMSLLDGFDGNKYLVVTKYHREITIV